MNSNKKTLTDGMSKLKDRPKYDAAVIEKTEEPSKIAPANRKVISISVNAYKTIRLAAVNENITITEMIDRLVELYNCR